MRDTFGFFNEFLPKKLADNPDLVQEGGLVFQFDIEGAGTWTLDLATGEVRTGPSDEPGCVMTASKETWDAIVENPMAAMQFFMTGELQASDPMMAMQLQQILQ